MSETHPPAHERLSCVYGRIRLAAARAGRAADAVTLVAVSKTFAASAIEPFLAAGHEDFGENRVQEALRKWPPLRESYARARLHLVGALQSNKAREAVATFDAIHSLDRDSLAEALAAECARQGRAPLLFVQVNTGAEPQKSGVAVSRTEAFVRRCRETLGLNVQGLMCLPPETHAPGPHFALLRQLARDCGLELLSMGMSGDFETAVQIGATHVRIGSSLFGSRAAAGDPAVSLE